MYDSICLNMAFVKRGDHIRQAVTLCLVNHCRFRETFSFQLAKTGILRMSMGVFFVLLVALCLLLWWRKKPRLLVMHSVLHNYGTHHGPSIQQ